MSPAAFLSDHGRGRRVWIGTTSGHVHPRCRWCRRETPTDDPMGGLDRHHAACPIMLVLYAITLVGVLEDAGERIFLALAPRLMHHPRDLGSGRGTTSDVGFPSLPSAMTGAATHEPGAADLDPHAPLTDSGVPMRRISHGYVDPACIHCDGTGYVGHGSAREVCECFVDADNVPPITDQYPNRP